MAVLRLLTSQVALFVKTGRTDQAKFRDDLGREGLAVSDPGLPTGDEEFDAFYNEVQKSGTSKDLLIKGVNFQFAKKSLERLATTRWLNDEVILACLHLADKLPFVRVGFSIPIHQQTRPHIPLRRPFQRARQQMAEWHSQVEPECQLVCFFPLHQHEDHFSLLEFNAREHSIYHYDSMGEGENTNVKVYELYPLRNVH